MSEYKIVDNFQVKSRRVLVLDRAIDFDDVLHSNGIARIGGQDYKYELNSVPSWLVVKSDVDFSQDSIILG